MGNISNFGDHAPVTPKQYGDINAIFDERGSQFLALRKIHWCKEGSESSEDQARLELRKWMVNSDGEERANKGFSFLTEEGPHELAKVLVHEGFGHTKDLLRELRTRNDFAESVQTINEDEDLSDGEYFDMRELMDSAIDDVEDEADAS